MSETVEITRYPNRRLYDRSRKAYVTLGDIESIVLNGRDLRVRDSKSDEDLTRVILTQIILERHPERMRMFPVAFLHSVLRADQISLDLMTAYLGQAKSVMDAFPGAIGANLVPGRELWQSLTAGMGRRSTSRPPSDPPQPSAGQQSPGSVPEDSQLALAEKLLEMEQRLKQLEEGSHQEEVSRQSDAAP